MQRGRGRVVYDNWARLAEAVVDRETLKRIALCPSLSSSAHSSSRSSFDFIHGDSASSSSSSLSRFPDGPSVGPYSNGETLPPAELKIYSYADLKKATRNFQFLMGGYPASYKGWVDEKTLMPSTLETGMMVAVKRLNPESEQGFEESKSELNLLGRLSHPNLVKLLGFCEADKNHFFVYEFMKKRILENHLFRSKNL